MDKKASEIMGEAVVAGVTLEAQETIKGMVGGVIGDVLAGVEVKPASIPGSSRQYHHPPGKPPAWRL